MGKTIEFNNFQTTFNRLTRQAKNKLLKINIEFYHHDSASEPFIHVEADIERIFMEIAEPHGKVITILTQETTFSFTERNHHTNLSNDDVVFSSKNDDETFCIISFI
ncbi:hypothetical protein [Lederbergia galactosidilytica]|uniref:Uncharacterized protein n=1 Tax=Lederbergia galactosidilytica TaxID=217031 RepID=A0A177ZQ05_9BACI|nr:hypothetical protein [Lederbergia galactosidilytica]OAK70052.1 hypothetical protein ABB05_12770 [Lederbergia galactosidilytica]